MKKSFSFILVFLIAFLPIFNMNNLSFADSEPSLTAEYAILMDYESGKVLYSKNGYSKLYPASTTKAWTAYVVLKHVKDLNQVVQIKDLPVVEGSSMYLKEGESFTVKELLDALLIHSCNDVAVVLAKYTAGSVSKGFWFLEFKKYVEYLNSGLTKKEIREMISKDLPDA